MRPPCDECAFSKKGAGTEPYNALRARVCSLGPLPFGCHHGTDWHGSSTWSAEKTAQTLRTVGICEGWRSEVRRLNAKGWFGKYRVIRRAVAKQALFCIEVFNSSEPGPVKKKYLRALKRMVKFLAEKDIERKKIPLIDLYLP